MDTQPISIAITPVLDESGLVWLDAVGGRGAGANQVMPTVAVKREVPMVCLRCPVLVIGMVSRVGTMMTTARERWGGKDGHRQEGGAY